MPIVLGDLFSGPEATALAAAAGALTFEDGRATAGRIARAVKENEQAAANAETEAVLEMVRQKLLSHPLFQAVTVPKSFVKLMVSRTSGGGQYGMHVDNALMAGARADVSFTLFLSAPDTYEGGALSVADRVEKRQFKLELGEAVVYPSNTLHRVEPVTSGERLVVIGWVTSWVADPAKREILFDLWQAIGKAEAAGEAEQLLLLSKARSNLIRMWAA